MHIEKILGISKKTKALFFFVDKHITKEQTEEIETYLTKKIGVKVVVLDSWYRGLILSI